MSDEEAAEAHRRRHLRWSWKHDQSWLRLSGGLPADQGAVVANAIERLVGQAPPKEAPIDDSPFHARCADALVGLASASPARDADADRATVVVHVDAEALSRSDCVADRRSRGDPPRDAAPAGLRRAARAGSGRAERDPARGEAQDPKRPALAAAPAAAARRRMPVPGLRADPLAAGP
ncbi:MAG: hypothetical protein ACRDJ4_01385 [Actinomycetota bacterium]